MTFLRCMKPLYYVVKNFLPYSCLLPAQKLLLDGFLRIGRSDAFQPNKRHHNAPEKLKCLSLHIDLFVDVRL